MKIKEDALSQGQIDAWKSEYGHIFKTIVDGLPVIWRKLRRKEYIEIMTVPTGSDIPADERLYERQEEVVRRTVIFPSDVEELIESSAGIATNLAEQIMDHSGFNVSEAEEL